MSRSRLVHFAAVVVLAGTGALALPGSGIGPVDGSGLHGTVSAAEPSPAMTPSEGPGASADPLGDPRVPAGGPGVIGSPGVAVAIVLLVGFGALVLTLAWVRLTPGRDDRR